MPVRGTPPHGSMEPKSSLELTLLDEGEWPATPLLAPAHSSPGRSPSLGTVRTLASDESRAQRVASVVLPREPARAPDESSLPATASGTDQPASETRAKLSLEQLGIGANAALDLAIQPLTKEQQASARLYAALHPPSVEVDGQRNRGAVFEQAGPVVAAAQRLVLDEDRLLETNAVLNVRVDAAGRVTEVHVLDASSQLQIWQMIAARLGPALATVKLRANGSGQGWGMKLRLASRVQLPSGAAPGMRLGVLGKQVAGSGGPGSTSLELSPTSKLDLKEPIDSIGRHLEAPLLFEVMLLKLRADPTDINAPERRRVEVAVLSIDPDAKP
jgi:hypothetical protein